MSRSGQWLVGVLDTRTRPDAEMAQRKHHVAAGVACTVLACLALPLWMYAAWEGARDLPRLTGVMAAWKWLLPLPLLIWAAGLAHTPWRQSATWSRHWARWAIVTSTLVALACQLPFFTLGCVV